MSIDPNVAFPAASLIVSLVAIGVTIWLWRADVARRRREDAAARRREVVATIVGLSERTARLATFNVVTKFWFRPELEWTLVLPRLHYGLDRADEVVARWAAIKIRRIQAAAGPKATVRETSELAYGIAAWERGELALAWFAERVGQADPLQGSWKVPWRAKARKYLTGSAEGVKFGLLLAVYAVGATLAAFQVKGIVEDLRDRGSS